MSVDVLLQRSARCFLIFFTGECETLYAREYYSTRDFTHAQFTFRFSLLLSFFFALPTTYSPLAISLFGKSYPPFLKHDDLLLWSVFPRSD